MWRSCSESLIASGEFRQVDGAWEWQVPGRDSGSMAIPRSVLDGAATGGTAERGGKRGH